MTYKTRAMSDCLQPPRGLRTRRWVWPRLIRSHYTQDIWLRIAGLNVRIR